VTIERAVKLALAQSKLLGGDEVAVVKHGRVYGYADHSTLDHRGEVVCFVRAPLGAPATMAYHQQAKRQQRFNRGY
jgi:hypothetical protein